MSTITQQSPKLNIIVQAEKSDLFDAEMTQIIHKIYEETKESSKYYWRKIKLSHSKSYQSIRDKKPREKAIFLLRLVDYFMARQSNLVTDFTSTQKVNRRKIGVTHSLIEILLRQRLYFEEAELFQLFDTFLFQSEESYYSNLPLKIAFIQFERYITANGLSENMTTYLKQLYGSSKLHHSYYYGPDHEKIRLKIDQLF